MSKLVWECSTALRELSNQNVLFFWVPGHCGIEGNEHADNLARQDSAQQFFDPEPFPGTSTSTIKSELRKQEMQHRVTHWLHTQGSRQAKQFVYRHPAVARKLLHLSRSELRTITGLLTGHCPALYHLKNIGKVTSNTCHFWNSEQQSSARLLCYCGALALLRNNFLGSYFLNPYQVWYLNPKKVISYINYIVPNWGSGLQPSSSSPSVSMSDL